jgi:hypothetical protein
MLVRGADRQGIWRLTDPRASAWSQTRQREILQRIKENTRFVAAAGRPARQTRPRADDDCIS